MSLRVLAAILITVVLWASAFVGIRAGIATYSPGGLALLRYLIASFCMYLVYRRIPKSETLRIWDKIGLMILGVFAIGIYSVLLNRGEVVVSAGVASFIVTQSPLITTFLAILFLGEKLSRFSVIGLLVSIFGILLICKAEQTTAIKWNMGMLDLLITTCISALYSISQKSLLKRCHAIEATSYLMWGGTLFLLLYTPALYHDLPHATFNATLVVIYLGIFPGAIGYICWSYALRYVPAARAASFLYFSPFIATLLGWLCLGEIPNVLSLIGGVIAMAGVWIVNHHYRHQAKIAAKALAEGAATQAVV